MSTPRLYVEVLDKRRQGLLPKLAFLRREYGFYLAGGTALALQIGHRTSKDFDFYTKRNFDPQALFHRLKRGIPQSSPSHVAEGTLMAVVQGVEMSFFRYEYPLLGPVVRTAYLDVLSVEDIAAMKMVSVVQRGVKRDLVDIAYLLRRFSLEALLSLTEKKYRAFNRYIGLRALTYFEDAEKDQSRARLGLFERISWQAVKDDIIKAVRGYQKELSRG